MTFSNDYENAILAHLFTNSDVVNIGDSGGLLGSATRGDLYVALHTAAPGEAGTQQTNEVAYTSYTRVGVERNSTGWLLSGNQISNGSLVQFPTCTGGSSTATHFSVGVDDGSVLGVHTMICYGALASPLTIVSGIQPQFAAGSLVITLD